MSEAKLRWRHAVKKLAAMAHFDKIVSLPSVDIQPDKESEVDDR